MKKKKAAKSRYSLNTPVPAELFKMKREQIRSFKAKMNQNRTITDHIADAINRAFGTSWFLILNALWFGTWILINLDLVPFIQPFDPFPFGLLTMMVSLEAIFLSIFVLISQNRASKIGDLREEIDLQINVQAEHEITRILCMVDEIHDHLGLSSEDDPELRKMKKRMDLGAIERAISKEMDDL